jgi:hypothetical protein
MRGTKTVDTHRLQHLQLALDGARVDRSAERAEIVMIANATYLYALAIEDEPFVNVKAKGANAEWRLVTIGKPASLLELRHNLVKIRALVRPKDGRRDLQCLTDFCL